MIPAAVFLLESKRLANEAFACPSHMTVKRAQLEAQTELALAMYWIAKREECFRRARG